MAQPKSDSGSHENEAKGKVIASKHVPEHAHLQNQEALAIVSKRVHRQKRVVFTQLC